jgi:deazaflavin-dependent oxidoreductase (nitroreductase family)
LTHSGARSGRLRQTSLYYCEDGGNLAVIASKVGAPENPSWYTNLMAHPDAAVQVGRQRERVRARLAAETERERIWRRMASIYPGYDTYQRQTERRIPVVVLEPIGTTSA